MSDEARAWLRYAEENLRVAALCLEADLYNPSLRNAQQAVEKALKAICLERRLPLKKTHSIGELAHILRETDIGGVLTDNDSALLDAIYLPSKYPLGSVLPDFEPDRAIAERCLSLAKETLREAHTLIERKK